MILTQKQFNETFGSEFNENNQTNNGNVTCDLAEKFEFVNIEADELFEGF